MVRLILGSLAMLSVVACQGTMMDHGGAAKQKTIYGPAQLLGDGTVAGFITLSGDGVPVTIGLSMDRGALDGLADEHVLSRLEMPETGAAGRVQFKWIGLNWEPHGHPPGAWSVPHFDVHFYLVDFEAIAAIRTGTCNNGGIHCDDMETALMPVPGQYVPTGHGSVGATVAAMGDHLINLATPELAQENPTDFTHTFIYGAYDGEITFLEPMITRAFLLSGANGCYPVKQPEAWQTGGYYPPEYCIRADGGDDDPILLTLEGLQKREPS